MIEEEIVAVLTFREAIPYEAHRCLEKGCEGFNFIGRCDDVEFAETDAGMRGGV